MSDRDSKRQILKSTGILGSAQLMIIGIGMVRVKILAILLGPAGVGIAGLYQYIIDLVRSFTSFGLHYSAVRDIASAAVTQDDRKIATIVLVLRRWLWATGLLGMMLCMVFSKQLSIWTFGNDKHITEIFILSSTLLLVAISSGQSAILQGFRMIGEMGKTNVLAAFIGLISASIIYYLLGLKGIVPVILATSVIGLFVNWYFTKKIKTVQVNVSPSMTIEKGKSMVRLGFFMSLSGLAGTATMYFVRSFIVQVDGLSSVGHFIAAWSISNMYISAVFGAMSADYFPKLSAVQNDSVEITKMVNEQSEVAVLLTVPIIIGMVSFLKLVVYIFYSKEFGPTVTILSWQLVGDFFKVISWPIGFILLAKGKSKLFITTELTWHFLFLGLVYFCWPYLNIEVTGIAFLIAYIIYAIIIYQVAVKMVNFRWSAHMKKYVLFFLPLLIFAFLCSRYLSGIGQYISGAILTMVAIFFSFSHLKKLSDFNEVLVKFKMRKK